MFLNSFIVFKKRVSCKKKIKNIFVNTIQYITIFNKIKLITPLLYKKYSWIEIYIKHGLAAIKIVLT
jgi:hypothetical protein